MGQLLSFGKLFGFIVGFGFLVAACSDNQGKLVDKSPSTAENTPQQIAAQNSPDKSAAHPPIGGQGMTDLMAGGKMPLPSVPFSEPVISGDRAKVASLEFTIDPSWVSEKPQSTMRVAQFRLPAPEGAQGDADLALFQGIGGKADDNIQRWIEQFSERSREPAIEKKQVGEFTVQILDISGVYDASSMMGGGSPKAGFRMLAAVVEGVTGGPWHFKLTGAEKTLEHWKPAFMALIDSIKLT